MGLLLKKSFGALALFIGVVLIGWFVYNQFSPTVEFRQSYRSPMQLFMPFLCIVVGWKWFRDQGKGIEEIIPPDLKCPELDEALAKARETLPFALEQAEKNVDGIYIKFPLTSPDGFTEHIWAYVHSLRDDLFNVSLANDPVAQPGVGRRDVAVKDVEDWQIMHADGTIKGGYSIIALFKYHQSRGGKLSSRMKQQKALLLDV